MIHIKIKFAIILINNFCKDFVKLKEIINLPNCSLELLFIIIFTHCFTLYLIIC